MKKILLTSIILLFVLVANAQLDVSYKTLGDKSFKNKDYYEAAYFYKKAATGLTEDPDKMIPYRSEMKSRKPVITKVDGAEVAFMLAESYRLYENYLEAEPWYYRILTDNFESKYPIARLWYGVCLRANQHFDAAIKQLQQFADTYKGTDQKLIALAKKEINNCTFAKEQYLYPSLLEAVKMKGAWNADGSNYSMVKRDGNYFFTSSRMIEDDKKHLARVYTMKASNIGRPDMISFKKDANKKSDPEYGTPSFSPTGNRMYISRWYKEGNKSVYSIYISLWQNGEWNTPVKLNSNVNVDGFKSIQPFITGDGKRMFFVSDKPGGQGGDDIWVSDLDGNGMPTNSINLGKVINTSFDEETPYFDSSSKRLIYSSKGFTGLGGFDFYESTDNIDNWSEAKNMGYPMNSAKDDLYYYPDNIDKNKFYISSDRESDCCLDLFEVYDKRHEFSGLVLDCETQRPLNGATISFIDSVTKQVIQERVTGPNGKYSFTVTTKRPHTMRIEKKSYFAKVVAVPRSGRMAGDTLISPDICLQPFEVNKPITIKNILYDFASANLRPESKTVLDGLVQILKDNPKIKIELSAHTDSIGSDAYNNKLSQDRAQSCVDYIILSGIEESRILAKGYGKTKPIAPNSYPDGKDNPDGRQLNRRTEFTVLKLE